jgi:UDP-3-O-[3-hydroxymyristoyl] glucosamine N-acyltransferase
MRLSEITRLLHGEVTGGDDVEIERVSKIEDAGPGDITFLANLKYKKHLMTTSAAAVLVEKHAQFEELHKRTSPLRLVRVADPYLSFLRLVDTFYPPAAPLKQGVHPTAILAQSAVIDSSAAIGAYVVIGEHSNIGRDVLIYHGTVIGDDVEIADGTILYENVTVRERCKIGKRNIVHSGTVIGSDGFGFAPKPDGTYEKIPQRGSVVIEDDVEIGANCTVDRATIGATRIKRGAKLDNLIQVAHNVVIGENTVIAGQAGISGSTKVGKNCAIGGQAGLTGHIEIADRTNIGAQSGVSKSITESGKTYFGYPATELQRALRIESATRRLPELLIEINQLQKRVQELESMLKVKASEPK